MNELIDSGRLIDLILALVLVEAGVLAAYRWRTGHGVPVAGLLGNLAAGACLLLALRIALVGGSHRLLAAVLTAAFAAHLFDLSRRWRWSPRPGSLNGERRAPRGSIIHIQRGRDEVARP